ncbi:FixH family protein [Wenxinia saemankumensis]|uniref:Nitrogen fixation protein FixH n=1 Tax=Wenxinia saemankumensis TaxID=1447782 RepID=A0A1M6CQS4_9RHOB|nr:FixH family protein [Wenxinia saemankumensis]SHI63336.1 Nitrogen fixation protein FixH [Wenxinia saemankumensis]
MTELRGIHVAGMFTFGFGIIIAVNVALATNAVRTFPGLEVANSYVASQSFEARREAQDALGWEVAAGYSDGLLTVALTGPDGAPAPAAELSGHVGRPTEARDDIALDLEAGQVAIDLAPGRWRLDLTATAPDGTLFERAVVLEVAP